MDIIFNGASHVIDVSDESYRYKEIKADNDLILKFSLAEYLEIPLGAYCVFEGETYTLKSPENLTMVNSENYEYTVTFKSAQANLSQYKFRNTVDRRLKFNLTARPQEHLQMLVDNLNQRESGWSIGSYIDLTEKLISYDHTYCIDALNSIADTFETEWEIVGKVISLRKVEYNKDAPLSLGYGKGKGFISGTSRSNVNDTPPIEVLFTQGSDTNLDTTAYGSPELLLPKFQALNYDGEFFEGETGYNPANAKAYITDSDGYSVKRSDKELTTHTEDSIDLSNIFPQRVGTVTEVQDIDTDKNWYNIIDSSIPDALNYEDCLIAGETMTIIFQTGMLAGREFDVKYSHEGGLIESSNFTVPLSLRTPQRFEIVPAELDGVWMPSEIFKPVVGDTYIVYNVMMPDAYISDDTTKTGASWDMYREAVMYLSDNEDTKFTFTGKLDTIWSNSNWLTYGGKFVLGGYIFFSNDDWLADGINVRITGLKTYVNKPHSPELTLSNAPVGSSFSSDLITIASKEVVVDENKKESTLFTKRRYSDVKTTMEMLNSALLTNFTESVNPITVQTMSLLVGDDALQFRFVDNTTNPTEVDHHVDYNSTHKKITADAGIIQHMTLGITTLTSSHAVSEYKFWTVPEYTSPVLDEPEKSYYFYLKAHKTNSSNCRFLLSETAIQMDDGVSDYYYLLVGILNAEYDGERSYASMYGFTEISPAGITANRIATSDGLSYIDFLSNKLHLGNDTSYLDWNNLQADTLTTTNLSLLNCSIKNTLNVDGVATLANFKFSNDRIESVKSEDLGASMILNGVAGSITSSYIPYGATSSEKRSFVLERGEVRIKNYDFVPKGVTINERGIYSDYPNTSTKDTLASHLGSIVGMGYTELDTINPSVPTTDENFTAGVIGKMIKGGTAPAYGGYFDNLFANGLLLSTRYVNEDTGPNPTEDPSLYKVLANSNTFVFSLGNTSNVITFILPSSPQVGQTIFFKNAGTKGLRIGTALYHSIYVGHTSVVDTTISAGHGAIATCVYISSDETDHRWSVIKI